MANTNPNNQKLRDAMSAVCKAFNKLSAKLKGNACIHGCECLRRGLDKDEAGQIAAVDEAYPGIGAPGDWGYGTAQGDSWYKLLQVCDEVEKAASAGEVANG